MQAAFWVWGRLKHFVGCVNSVHARGCPYLWNPRAWLAPHTLRSEFPPVGCVNFVHARRFGFQTTLYLFLEGRLKVFLHIDEVIKVIRESDDPKTDLMAAFGLTEIQAEDILEIRLRQLARLEGFKLEKELNELREEQGRLNILLGDENEKRKLIIKEMQADMKQFGDPRRQTLDQRRLLDQQGVLLSLTQAVTRRLLHS